MKKLIMTLLAVGALSFTGYGKGPAQKYIEQELKTDSLFNNAIIVLTPRRKQADIIISGQAPKDKTHFVEITLSGAPPARSGMSYDRRRTLNP